MMWSKRWNWLNSKLYQSETDTHSQKKSYNDFTCSYNLHNGQKKSAEEQLCEDWDRATIIFDTILTDHY